MALPSQTPLSDERVARYLRMALACLDCRDGKITVAEKDAIVKTVFDELFPPDGCADE